MAHSNNGAFESISRAISRVGILNVWIRHFSVSPTYFCIKTVKQRSVINGLLLLLNQAMMEEDELAQQLEVLISLVNKSQIARLFGFSFISQNHAQFVVSRRAFYWYHLFNTTFFLPIVIIHKAQCSVYGEATRKWAIKYCCYIWLLSWAKWTKDIMDDTETNHRGKRMPSNVSHWFHCPAIDVTK